MKKNVIGILAFALFLMVALTMLSLKVEDEMLTEVVVRQIEPKEAGKCVVAIPLTYLYFDDETIDVRHLDMDQLKRISASHLYQVKKGTGWEDGLRLKEVDKNVYVLDAVNKGLTGFDETKGWTFVDYASRQPQASQKVKVLDTKETARGRYLVIYPEQVPEINWKLEGMSIAAQTEKALILEVKEVRQPFIQERAKEQIKDLNTAGCRVYSVETVEQFLQNLPAVVGVAVLFFAALVIWIQSMFLLKDHWENRWLLTANFVLGLGLLWGLWYLLGKIDLPSDLLPAENIFQWSHYSGEFSQIMSALDETRGSLFDSMKHLGRTGQNTINLAFRMTVQVKEICIMSTFLLVLWVGVTTMLRRICTIGLKQ